MTGGCKSPSQVSSFLTELKSWVWETVWQPQLRREKKQHARVPTLAVQKPLMCVKHHTVWVSWKSIWNKNMSVNSDIVHRRFSPAQTSSASHTAGDYCMLRSISSSTVIWFHKVAEERQENRVVIKISGEKMPGGVEIERAEKREKRRRLPLTTSSAKFETPEPLGDWVTQR